MKNNLQGAKTMAGQALKKENQFQDNSSLQGMVDAINLTQAVIEFKPDGTILNANDNFCAAVGYDLSEIKGQHHSTFVEAEYGSSLEYKQFWKDLAAGKHNTNQFKRIRKDGSEIWIQASYTPIFAQDGSVEKVVKFASDITEIVAMTQKAQMVDLSPINTMFANPEGVLQYMNENAATTLRTLERHLPATVDKLVGNSIDWFHQDPEIQRRIIRDERNLPHRTIIEFGNEKLDLLISPVKDRDGTYIGPMVTWEVVTEKLKNEAEMARMKQMVDLSPINTMMADKDGNMIYMNEKSLETLKGLEQYLPDKAENLTGRSIDILHKNPEYQRKIIGNENNLPHRAVIEFGPEKLDLLVSPIRDHGGTYLGPMVTWEVVTSKHELVNELTHTSEELATSSEELLSIANQMAANAEETASQTRNVGTASEELNSGVQTVAANMEEMTASIREITKQTNESSNETGQAADIAKSSNDTILKLGESSQEIGNIVKVITSIAQQTNLLALNATIEAARAGEAGKGFAVVANEVKELAKQTAAATVDISKKVETIQDDSSSAVTSIGDITEAIERLTGIASSIATAMEEQSATTSEVSRVVNEASEGVKQIDTNINQVSTAASETGHGASQTQVSAKRLTEIAQGLKTLVAKIDL